jgi:hypothetical protein
VGSNVLCIVSSADICLCFIVTQPRRRSIGLHSATRQISYGIPSEKQLLYELRVAHGHFSRCLSNALIFKLTGALDYMLSIALNGTLQMHSTSSSITYYTVANWFLATSILYLQDSRLSISSRYLWQNPWYTGIAKREPLH